MPTSNSREFKSLHGGVFLSTGERDFFEELVDPFPITGKVLMGVGGAGKGAPSRELQVQKSKKEGEHDGERCFRIKSDTTEEKTQTVRN